MTNSNWVLFSILASTLATGCAHHRSLDPLTVHAGDERPPDFLTGPVATLLTNVDGFSAQLEESAETGGVKRQRLKGILIQREGRLIFQPSHSERKRPKEAASGVFFIWNESQEQGYVLSEELQAYAPIASQVRVTNLTYSAKESALESLQDHPCRKVEATVALSDGSTARFLEWQAEGLKGFPLRVSSVDLPTQLTLDFSDVRLGYAAPQLFNPPAGFTQYPNAIALMNELMIRQSTLKQRPGELENEMPTTGVNSWQNPASPGPLR